MKHEPFSVTAYDLLGAIALQAQIIVAAAGEVAAGRNFPDPVDIRRVVDRMAELNAHLTAMKASSPKN